MYLTLRLDSIYKNQKICQRQNLVIVDKEMNTCQTIYSLFSTDNRIKLKDSMKLDKYQPKMVDHVQMTTRNTLTKRREELNI